MSNDDDFIPLEDDGSSTDNITPIPDSANDQLLADAIPIDSLAELAAEASAPAAPTQAPPAASPPPPPPRKAAAAANADPTSFEPIDLADDDADDHENRQIRNFEKAKKAEDLSKWKRTPDPQGTSAIRCKSFVAKLRLDAIEHLDEQINLWLDEHPDYTVKHVVTSVGMLTGKAKEEALFVNVFV